jgi:RNA polymerase sigma factor (sigma-70 family)
VRPNLLNPVLQRLQANRADPEAWEHLYRLLWPWLLWNAQRDLRTPNLADAEDLSQDVFLTLIDRADFELVFDHPGIFLAYVRRICKHRAIDRLRGSGARKEANLILEELPGPPSVDPLLRIGLEEAATKLAPKEAKLFQLLTAELSTEEISKQLNVTKQTTSNMLSNLRRVLRNLTGRSKD